jgi:phosphoglycolate phosphatase
LRPVRLVVFDLDGTLVDSSQDLAAAVNEALRGLFPEAPALTLDEVRSFVGSGASVLVSRSLARAGLAASVDTVLPVFLAAYRRRLLDRTRLYPGVEEALDGLGACTLAVLSNKPGDLSREILERLGIARHFFRVYGPQDVPARKPDPAGLLRIAAEAGLPPEQGVMVGDSAIDVRTGRAAGMATVGVRYGYDPEGLAAEPPDFLVDDLRGLLRLSGLGLGSVGSVLT